MFGGATWKGFSTIEFAYSWWQVIEDLFAMLAKTENEREKRFAVVLRTMLCKQEERKRTSKVRFSQSYNWLLFLCDPQYLCTVS